MVAIGPKWGFSGPLYLWCQDQTISYYYYYHICFKILRGLKDQKDQNFKKYLQVKKKVWVKNPIEKSFEKNGLFGLLGLVVR